MKRLTPKPWTMEKQFMHYEIYGPDRVKVGDIVKRSDALAMITMHDLLQTLSELAHALNITVEQRVRIVEVLTRAIRGDQ